MKKAKISKDTVPSDFTLGLALVDSIPVVLFGITFLILGARFKSSLFMAGALLCLLSGMAKVIWKIIVVLEKKNIWPLFIQMRALMPVGFLIIIASVILGRASLSSSVLLAAVSSFPASLFFILGIAGMLLMFFFAFRLDSSDARSNWIEQITNSFAQLFILLGVLLAR